MSWDAIPGRGGSDKDKYVVIQVVLTEKFLGTGSGTVSLTNVKLINKLLRDIGYIRFQQHLLDQKAF